MPDIWILAIVLILSVIFDFINGFHDTANSIATVISTRVLPPAVAIGMSAVLNFVGALSGTAVAKTIGSGIIGTNVPEQLVVAALIGAIVWNLITWYYGIPSSSSHALVGGLIGAGIGFSGFSMVRWTLLIQKVLFPFLVSPIAGFIGALILIRVLFLICGNLPYGKVNGSFRKLQILSSAYMSFSHGSNDAQKTMGIITLALISTHRIPAAPFTVPIWVIALSACAMALGTAGGGWRIIKTMGTKLFPLTPIDGFSAETAAATVIEIASRLGFPLSTTHIISSSILGVGAGQKTKSVHWSVAGNIIKAWVLTIPISSLLSYIAFILIKRL